MSGSSRPPHRARVQTYRNVLGDIGAHRGRFEALVKSGGKTIFNPDRKRLQLKLCAEDEVVQSILRCLNGRGLLRGRLVGDAYVLHSKRGCRAQQLHTDYEASAVRALRRKPLSVLVALQDGTSLTLKTERVLLNAGDMCTFEGDVMHAGSAYDSHNTRLFMYIPTPLMPAPVDTTYLEVTASPPKKPIHPTLLPKNSLP